MPFHNPADDDAEFAQPMLSVRTSREAAFVALEEDSWKLQLADFDSAKTPKPVLVTGFVFSGADFCREDSGAQA